MIYLHNDYSEGCHPQVLKKLIETNMEQTPGYGEDIYCSIAADLIRKACACKDLDVHFLVGGTQANLTVIDAALRPHQAALCAETGHINVHETGAVEATGHKVLSVSSPDGKISAKQVRDIVQKHRTSSSFEHEAQPKLVYISNPTELGTLYRQNELQELYETCQELGLFLFLDGARLGYGLAASENDLTLETIARFCDVFYIGGTKVGALFGEAIVIKNIAIREDFRYLIKQHGGMLAKGRLLGIQFCALFEDGLYFRISEHAIRLADRIRDTFIQLQVPFLVENTTNQIFPILSDSVLERIREKYVYTPMERIDDTHQAVRFCTSWATTEENVEAFCAELRTVLA